MVLAAGCTPDRISYGNTIKKESEIAAAFRLGVTLFAIDCEAEVEKVARAAPGSRVICRIHCDGSGSEWPLSRKFGCEPDYAGRYPGARAQARALVPYGLSVHVGSQQTQRGGLGPGARARLRRVPRLRGARHLALHGQSRRWLPGPLCAQDAAARKLRQGDLPRAAAPLRQQHFRRPSSSRAAGSVGNAGIIEAEVVLVAKRSPEDEVRWVYLDIGKFHGLAETIEESIRYPIRPRSDRDEMAPCVIAGPTCDSVDVLYEKNPYPLPVSLAIGDKVLIEATGAIQHEHYSTVGFQSCYPAAAGNMWI
jgi:ornithine decarboxylase